jgi:AraC-like DNA-binding protein
MVELGRRGTKTKLNPKRLELRRSHEPKDGLGEYFGCPVKYRAHRDALVLREAELELPFATHNEELLQMLTPQLEQALSKERIEHRVLDQAKWILKRLLPGSRADLAMVAKELGMGERTLQRRITNEGNTFRKLLSEARHELAVLYLSDPLIEPAEAAFLVGFDDPNSFYRAFRSWEGKTQCCPT